MGKKFYWNFLKMCAIILSVAVFTPLVIPAGKHEPGLFGFPYTLWAGILVSLLLVIITWLATRVHPGRNNTTTDG